VPWSGAAREIATFSETDTLKLLSENASSRFDDAANPREQRRSVIPRSNEFDSDCDARNAISDPCRSHALIANNIEVIDRENSAARRRRAVRALHRAQKSSSDTMPGNWSFRRMGQASLEDIIEFWWAIHILQFISMYRQPLTGPSYNSNRPQRIARFLVVTACALNPTLRSKGSKGFAARWW